MGEKKVDAMSSKASGLQSVVPRPILSASFRNLLEMQIRRPHLRPIESDSLGMGPSNLFQHAFQLILMPVCLKTAVIN